MTPTNRKPTNPPTMTLGSLRELARRKGIASLKEWGETPSYYVRRLDLNITNSVTTALLRLVPKNNDSPSLTLSGHGNLILQVIHAALSALPDASKGKKGK